MATFSFTRLSSGTVKVVTPTDTFFIPAADCKIDPNDTLNRIVIEGYRKRVEMNSSTDTINVGGSPQSGTATEIAEVLATDIFFLASRGILVIQYVDKLITHAQLIDLIANPITILAAPGAGKSLLLHYVYLHTHILTPYANTGGLIIAFSGNTDLGHSSVLVDLLQLEDTDTNQAEVATGFYNTAFPVQRENEPLVLANVGSEVSGGESGNTVSIRLYYSEVPVMSFGS